MNVNLQKFRWMEMVDGRVKICTFFEVIPWRRFMFKFFETIFHFIWMIAFEVFFFHISNWIFFVRLHVGAIVAVRSTDFRPDDFIVIILIDRWWTVSWSMYVDKICKIGRKIWCQYAEWPQFDFIISPIHDLMEIEHFENSYINWRAFTVQLNECEMRVLVHAVWREKES